MSMFLLLLELSFVLFGLQLVLCFKAKLLLWKSLPVMLVGLADTVLWILMVIYRAQEVSFGFFGLAFVGLVWLGGLAASWLLYGLVRFVQNLGRKFGV